MKKILSITILLLAGQVSCFGCAADKTSVDEVLLKMDKAAANIRNYRADIEFIDKDMIFDSTVVRTGKIYYANEPNCSALRINLLTRKEDDYPAQAFKEDFVFDGVWLVRVDYQNKMIHRDQLTDANKPIEPMELAGRNFPLIGFGQTTKLKKDFNIDLKSQNTRIIELNLVPEPNTMFAEKYRSIIVEVSKSDYLPGRITAQTSEQSIITMEFSSVSLNKKLEKTVFIIETRSGFAENINALKKSSDR